MQVEQAVFTSARSKKSQGYHVVAASPGVQEGWLRALAVWGPSHSALLSDEKEAESLNFHPLADGYVAVSRTIHGGPEYSGRRGLQVFTRFLILQPDHLDGYGFNPLEFAQTALAVGELRLALHLPESLPVVDLPDRVLSRVDTPPGESRVPITQLQQILALGGRVAVLGLENPLAVLSQLINRLPESERTQLSFCTGLRPALEREFRVQFAHQPDAGIYKQYASMGIDHVTAS